MSNWRPYPLHRPDPGEYVVALFWRGRLLYWVARWECGEWLDIYEDDHVVAFLPFEPFRDGECAVEEHSGGKVSEPLSDKRTVNSVAVRAPRPGNYPEEQE